MVPIKQSNCKEKCLQLPTQHCLTGPICNAIRIIRIKYATLFSKNRKRTLLSNTTKYALIFIAIKCMKQQ